MRATVSVLIPTYNRASLIAETIDSILAQTRPPDEVIVADDGSTDNTREVVEAYGGKVRYHLTENGGAPRARNIAASLASCDYYAFCDSDDLWRADKLEKQMGLLESHPEVHYSFTNFSLVHHGCWRQKTEFEHSPDDTIAPYAGDEPSVILYESFYDQLLEFQPTRPSSVIISAPLFKKLGGFGEQFGRTRWEDVEFALRCVQHPPIGVIREPVVGIRLHPGNISADNYKVLQGQIKILEYALAHHSLSESTRAHVLEQIELCRVDASYHAFRRAEFDQFLSLIASIPRKSRYLKIRMKSWISTMPPDVGRRMIKLLVLARPETNGQRR